MLRLIAAIVLLSTLPFTASCVRDDQRVTIAEGLPRVKLVNAYEALKFERPLWFGHDGASKEHVYVIEQAGRIYRFENKADVASARLFLDITSKVFSNKSRGGHNEEGLLAMAFHPKFKENGYFYVNYNAGDARNRRSVLARFSLDKKDKGIADPASEKVIWDFQKPYGNHNGCCLLFDKDGMLLVSYGDGGAANDPHDYGQNLGVWFAKILRIDVDNEENGKPYGIPKDNPFLKREGAKPEVWAYGLRNAWRMSWDGDDLWVGDVGQNKWEWVVIAKKGGNYGWSLKEGTNFFKEGKPVDEITPPIVEYSHKEGQSITGGYVYRGAKQEKLKGLYFYADYQSGRFWALRYAKGKLETNGEVLEKPLWGIASFGVDADNELYVCTFNGGRIMRVEAAE